MTNKKIFLIIIKKVRILGGLSEFIKNLWCQERDLNPRPPAYETSALTS